MGVCTSMMIIVLIIYYFELLVIKTHSDNEPLQIYIYIYIYIYICVCVWNLEFIYISTNSMNNHVSL